MNRPHTPTSNGAKRVRIALVDDHLLFRAGLRALLERSPHWQIVGEARSEAELLHVLTAANPEVVLMDLHLCTDSGISLTRRVVTEFPHTRVIAVSSDSAPDVVQAAVVAGVSGYVLKENAADELEHAIASVIAGRTYFCAEVSSTVINNLRHHVSAPPVRPSLTEREIAIVRLIADGKRNKEIADELGVTAKSAETFRLRVMRKLGLDSSAAVTRFAIREGYIKA